MTALSIEDAQALLDDNTSPWVRELGMTVEAVEPGAVRVRLPFHRRLVHSGGVVCGQALMGVADAAMLIAIANEQPGRYGRATVSLNMSFMRPVAEADVTAVIRVLRQGRTLSFGDVTLYGQDLSRPVGHATVTYVVGTAGE